MIHRYLRYAHPVLLNSTTGQMETSTCTLSERIKTSLPVDDFIRKYVEPSDTGRGLCPFHDDQHASFAVNIEENYWHCFAGCGGGSVIDFWMKMQDCDLPTAIKELAETIL